MRSAVVLFVGALGLGCVAGDDVDGVYGEGPEEEMAWEAVVDGTPGGIIQAVHVNLEHGSICSGGLLKSRVVITAAHCVVDGAGQLVGGTVTFPPLGEHELDVSDPGYLRCLTKDSTLHCGHSAGSAAFSADNVRVYDVGDGAYPNADDASHFDVALVRLDTALPTWISDADDPLVDDDLECDECENYLTISRQPPVDGGDYWLNARMADGVATDTIYRKQVQAFIPGDHRDPFQILDGSTQGLGQSIDGGDSGGLLFAEASCVDEDGAEACRLEGDEMTAAEASPGPHCSAWCKEAARTPGWTRSGRGLCAREISCRRPPGPDGRQSVRSRFRYPSPRLR